MTLDKDVAGLCIWRGFAYLHLVLRLLQECKYNIAKTLTLSLTLTNGIELKTINEALKINFGEEFHKLIAMYISHIFELKAVTISFNPPSKKKPTKSTVVYDSNGCSTGDLEGLTQFCYEEGARQKLIPYYKQNFLNIFKTRADVERQMLIEHSIPINGLYIESDKEKYFITSVTFTLLIAA